jgi:hypothetical protein
MGDAKSRLMLSSFLSFSYITLFLPLINFVAPGRCTCFRIPPFRAASTWEWLISALTPVTQCMTVSYWARMRVLFSFGGGHFDSDSGRFHSSQTSGSVLPALRCGLGDVLYLPWSKRLVAISDLHRSDIPSFRHLNYRYQTPALPGGQEGVTALGTGHSCMDFSLVLHGFDELMSGTETQNWI